MQIMKNLRYILIVLAMVLASPNAKSAEECFEGASRVIFKFNMAVDDIILESATAAGAGSARRACAGGACCSAGSR